MSDDVDDFRASYAAALNRYLRDDGSGALHIAREFGHRVLEEQLTLSELSAAYHQALIVAMLAAPDTTAAEQLVRTASRFYLESLTVLDLALGELRELARVERRNATLLRQLSTFLTDPSLVLSTDSVDEALRLVVEQAREILGADCAQATVQLGDELPITA